MHPPHPSEFLPQHPPHQPPPSPPSPPPSPPQVLPAALELYGLVVLFVRIHRLPAPSNTLPLLVATYLGGALLLANTLFSLHPTAAEHPLLRLRYVKLGLQFLVLTFLLGAAEYDAFLRVLPPALIAAGGTKQRVRWMRVCVCVCVCVACVFG
jgi:hypothetical protein